MTRELDLGREGVLAPVELEELTEFLEADLLPEQADPAFKERLRLRLRGLVLARRSRSADDETAT